MIPATKIVTLVFLLTYIQTFAQQPQTTKDDSSLRGLLIPALIAAFGFVGKSIYELLRERRKRKTQNIVDKLKLFYWPVLLRFEKNNAIWDEILCKPDFEDSTHSKIIKTAEKGNVLKNQQEILDIIDKYVYLAEPDETLTTEIKEYIIRATKFRALEKSGEVTNIPLEQWADAALRSDKFFEIIKGKTALYQNKLNKESIL